MNIEEIEESKKCLNEIIQNTYAEGKAIKLDNLRKYIQELEQKESILDKVTDKLKEDIEIDKVEWYEDGKITEKQFKAKNVNRKEYAREILNIIEGGNNGK